MQSSTSQAGLSSSIPAVPKWAKNWSKALSEQAQTVSDKWQGKVPPMDNDPLHNQRRELNEYMMICNSMQKSLIALSNLLDSVALQGPAADEIHKTVLLSEFAASPELSNTTERHAEAWNTIIRHYDAAKGSVQQLQFEVKNRLNVIQQAQKVFEIRDRKYRKKEEDEKKVEKLRDSSKTDPYQLEKMTTKAERAAKDFAASTLNLSDQLNHILAGRQRFLQDTSKLQLEIQSDFLAKLSMALSEIATASGGSRLRSGRSSNTIPSEKPHVGDDSGVSHVLQRGSAAKLDSKKMATSRDVNGPSLGAVQPIASVEKISSQRQSECEILDHSLVNLI